MAVSPGLGFTAWGFRCHVSGGSDCTEDRGALLVDGLLIHRMAEKPQSSYASNSQKIRAPHAYATHARQTNLKSANPYIQDPKPDQSMFHQMLLRPLGASVALLIDHGAGLQKPERKLPQAACFTGAQRRFVAGQIWGDFGQRH